MTKYIVKYQRIPLNYNDPANAIVEAEDADTARELVRQQLGDGNGVRNYVVSPAKEYKPVESQGRIVTMNQPL